MLLIIYDKGFISLGKREHFRVGSLSGTSHAQCEEGLPSKLQHQTRLERREPIRRVPTEDEIGAAVREGAREWG